MTEFELTEKQIAQRERLKAELLRRRQERKFEKMFEELWESYGDDGDRFFETIRENLS